MEEEVLARINGHSPHILFVALGAPNRNMDEDNTQTLKMPESGGYWLWRNFRFPRRCYNPSTLWVPKSWTGGPVSISNATLLVSRETSC